MIFAALLLSLASALGLAHQKVKFEDDRTGTIRELRSDALVLEDARKRRIAVRLSNVTIVHRDGRDVELSALRIGDHVLVEVMPNEAGELDAVMVRAKSPKKPKTQVPAKSVPR